MSLLLSEVCKLQGKQNFYCLISFLSTTIFLLIVNVLGFTLLALQFVGVEMSLGSIS